MAFLNIDGEYYWMDGDGISVDKVIKKKIWKMVPTKMGPKLAPLDDFKLSHGKIYGNSQVRANHIVEAFRKNGLPIFPQIFMYADWSYCFLHAA